MLTLEEPKAQNASYIARPEAVKRDQVLAFTCANSLAHLHALSSFSYTTVSFEILDYHQC